MNDMFYAYAYEHPKKRIIDLQLINYLKAEQEEEKGKETPNLKRLLEYNQVFKKFENF